MSGQQWVSEWVKHLFKAVDRCRIVSLSLQSSYCSRRSRAGQLITPNYYDRGSSEDHGAPAAPTCLPACRCAGLQACSGDFCFTRPRSPAFVRLHQSLKAMHRSARSASSFTDILQSLNNVKQTHIRDVRLLATMTTMHCCTAHFAPATPLHEGIVLSSRLLLSRT